jgi:cellulose synthase (UDP-forming)
MKPVRDTRARLVLTRIIGIVAIAFGLNYIIWRYFYSLNTKSLWFSIPMVIAETYGIIDMILFVIMSWRKPTRMPPPPPLEHATVDVFITTYNEAEDLVRMTAEAALRIDWPYKKVYILDDGSRTQMKAPADTLGCGYISRGREWENKPRHAKAGNINNALLETDGDFILVLDADQIPAPDILKKTLGFFRDEKMSFVQTPQYFYNLPPGDPFGNEASLFYGPIQQGKDGWNAAFFCGSNAVLRREALMQLGVQEYVSSVETRMKRTIVNLNSRLKRIHARDSETKKALRTLRSALKESKAMMKSHIPLESISDHIVSALRDAERLLARRDLSEIAQALQDLAQIGDTKAADVSKFVARNLDRITQKVPSTMIGNLDISEEEAGVAVVSRSDEAIPVQALSTISITEDMATAMSLHAVGWKSVFYPEVLAYGLAPEDFRSSLKQRLRWAQGTVQVFVRKNPFLQKGLSFPRN